MTTKVALRLGVIGLQPLAQVAEHGQIDAAGRLVEQHQPRPAMKAMAASSSFCWP